jgi:hypothetical protein
MKPFIAFHRPPHADTERLLFSRGMSIVERYGKILTKFYCADIGTALFYSKPAAVKHSFRAELKCKHF